MKAGKEKHRRPERDGRPLWPRRVGAAWGSDDGLRAARDAAGHAMGGKYRGAVYNLTMHKNATYLSDVWLWRYPQLPHEDGVEMLSRDGRPREGIGASPPW